MELHCNYCGKLYNTIDGSLSPARFCSPACRESFEIKKILSKPRYKPKTCKYCGKIFSPGTVNQIFCSKTCAGRFHNAEHSKKETEWEQREKKVEEPEKPKLEKTLDDYAREADECGLSYGKYKGLLRLGKTYEELKADYEKRLNNGTY